MSTLRFLYFKSGEIVMLAAAAAFVLYLVNAFASSETILENEANAGRTARAIFLAEQARFQTHGAYVGFEKLIAASETLASLEPISLRSYASYSSMSLASNGDYYFLIKMEYPATQAADIVSGKTQEVATRFHCVCWPVRYTFTGECAYYINSEGGMAASNNNFGGYDGLKGFPYDDFTEPAKASETLEHDGSSLWFRVEELPFSQK